MAKTLTINETLLLMKSVEGRLEDLKGLRNVVAAQVALKGYYDPKTQTMPEYVNPSVTITDQKITELQYFLCAAEAAAETAIEESNRVSRVDFDFDIDSLLKPLGESILKPHGEKDGDGDADQT